MSKMVRYTLDTLPPMTDERLAELVALSERPDSEIDLSDMPEWTDADWARAVRRDNYRPTKAQVTARLDSDVLDWLKSPGRGYQSRMNAILRREMLNAMAVKKTG